MSRWDEASAPWDDDGGAVGAERFSLRASLSAIATGALMVAIIGVLAWVALTGGGPAATPDDTAAAAAPAQARKAGEVPSVIGATQAAAMATLRAAGFEGVITVSRADDAVAKGQIANQIPKAGAKVPKGSEVQLALSLGSADRPVPSLAGYPISGALTLLQRAGLGYTATTEWSNQPSGTVLRSTPSAGAVVAKGTQIALVLSSGPAWDLGAAPPTTQSWLVPAQPALPAQPVYPGTQMRTTPTPTTPARPSTPLSGPYRPPSNRPTVVIPPTTRPPTTRPPVTDPPHPMVTHCYTSEGPNGYPWTLCG